MITIVVFQPGVNPMKLFFRILFLIALVSFPFSFPAAQDLDEPKSCMECHAEADIQGERDGKEKSMFVDLKQFEASVHKDAGCTGCHTDITELPHDAELKKVDCSACHTTAEELKSSVHDVANGPVCADCHGDAHKILPASDPNSLTNLFRVANVCGKCHSDSAIMAEYSQDVLRREMLYRESVHATELLRGNSKAPSCVHCHGSHAILPLRDPKSRTNFMNVAETCGQCHTTEKEQYQESVHGKSAAYGHKDAPICTDCHGEHAIFRVTDERSPVSYFNVAGNTCGRCHSSIVINEKYNIPTGRVKNYFESYHGLALQHGAKKVALCSSCHGNHLILPSSDPRSTVSPQRLVETCGKCHPGITTNVLAAPIHSEVTLRSDAIAAWVPRIYIPLIVLIIGGMLVHNGVILWALLREKFKRESSQLAYQRFSRFEIICHILLTVTFIILVITGFALVSPNSWWVTMLSYAGFGEGIRSITHRVAGVLMIGTSVAYAFYMLAFSRGRMELVSFLFWPRDIRHVWENLGYYLGKRSEPPRFDRYDYAEKMEFWALVWGVIIMAVTGLILWFPILAFQYLPKWAIDIAELIHYYEAVLATLAILVWHFFFVIFHPEEYPMSVTWLNGRMSLHHLRNRHPLEYERTSASESRKEETEPRETADANKGNGDTES